MGHCTASPGSNQWGGTTMQSISAAEAGHAFISPYGVGEGSGGGFVELELRTSAGSNPNPLTMASSRSLTPCRIGDRHRRSKRNLCRDGFHAPVRVKFKRSELCGHRYRDDWILRDGERIESWHLSIKRRFRGCGLEQTAVLRSSHILKARSALPDANTTTPQPDTKYDNTYTSTGTTITFTDSPFTSTAVDSGKRIDG